MRQKVSYYTKTQFHNGFCYKIDNEKQCFQRNSPWNFLIKNIPIKYIFLSIYRAKNPFAAPCFSNMSMNNNYFLLKPSYS